MSNWLNLIMSVLLMGLCLCCFMRMGHYGEIILIEEDMMPQTVLHNYKFYNQNTTTLLATIGVAGLSLFYLWHFVTKATKALIWKDIIVFFLFVLVFIKTSIELRQKKFLQYDMGYSFMLGFTITISVLFLLLLFVGKRWTNSPLPITDVLDEPLM